MAIWNDNNACIKMGRGLRGTEAAKHFEVRLAFLNERFLNKPIDFARIETKGTFGRRTNRRFTATALPAFMLSRYQVLKEKVSY